MGNHTVCDAWYWFFDSLVFRKISAYMAPAGLMRIYIYFGMLPCTKTRRILVIGSYMFAVRKLGEENKRNRFYILQVT